jgi:hypothetical protein
MSLQDISTHNIDVQHSSENARMSRTSSRIVRLVHAAEYRTGEFVLAPEDCLLLLTTFNTNNRRVRSQNVIRYADSFSSKVLNTGDTIKFDTNGRLIDGQHRLYACVQSGVPFKTLVAFGCDPEAFKVLDPGHGARSSEDVFQSGGVSRAHETASMVRWVMYLERGELATRPSYTAEERYDFFKANMDDVLTLEALRVAERGYKQTGFSKAALAGLYYYLTVEDCTDVDEFFEAIAEGTHRKQFHGIGALVKYRAKLDALPGVSMSDGAFITALIKVWNSYKLRSRVSVANFNNIVSGSEKAVLK